jgi:ubiquinone/menaquinone biosynthesis C-methylase UbiE
MSSDGMWRRLLWKYWYPYTTKLTKKASVTFLNYGYSDDQPVELQQQDEKNRMWIQLYHHVVESVDLSGLDVMEVSCGQGGGADYVTRYRQPKSMLGVDRNPKAISFCQQQHTDSRLRFEQGDAENMQYQDNSFDVIINVEASHCYGSTRQFFKEVYRLLRPGGYFLIADLRMQDDFKFFDKQLHKTGMEVLQHNNITANVLQALTHYDETKRNMIQQLVPRLFRRLASEFAGVKGSYVYNAFESGKMTYHSYVLRKPDE